MKLLRAELAKLRRPLTWGVAGAAAVFCVLPAAGGAHKSKDKLGVRDRVRAVVYGYEHGLVEPGQPD